MTGQFDPEQGHTHWRLILLWMTGTHEYAPISCPCSFSQKFRTSKYPMLSHKRDNGDFHNGGLLIIREAIHKGLNSYPCWESHYCFSWKIWLKTYFNRLLHIHAATSNIISGTTHQVPTCDLYQPYPGHKVTLSLSWCYREITRTHLDLLISSNRNRQLEWRQCYMGLSEQANGAKRQRGRLWVAHWSVYHQWNVTHHELKDGTLHMWHVRVQ